SRWRARSTRRLPARRGRRPRRPRRTARPGRPRRRKARRSWPQPGEQVVLGQRRPGGVADPDEALAAEGGLGDLRRDLAEPRLAADLATVREQRLALAGEHRADVDGGGDALLGLEPAAHPLRVRLFPVRHLRAELAQRLPDLAPVAAAHRAEVELGRAAIGGERLLGRTARVHMIRMLVRTLVVVRDQHLRPVRVDQPRDPGRHVRLGDVAESVRPVLVVPFQHAGVAVPEELEVGHAQDRAGLAELGQALLGDRLLVVPVLPRLDPAVGVAELAIGTRHDHGPDALGGVGRQHPAGARRLVVGVRVHRHHRQLFCHDSRLPDAMTCLARGYPGPASVVTQGGGTLNGNCPGRRRGLPGASGCSAGSAPRWPGPGGRPGCARRRRSASREAGKPSPGSGWILTCSLVYIMPDAGDRSSSASGNLALNLGDTRRMSRSCRGPANRLGSMHQELADLELPEPDAVRLPGLAGVRDIRGRIGMWRALLDRPLTSYYLVLGITMLLLGLGLVMVQSTGSVADLAAGLGPYSDFKKQLLGAAVGLPLMWVAARSSPRLFRALAYPLLAVAVVGLCLTLIHGVGVTQ